MSFVYRNRRSAFTIIELLVAATITLVLVGLMLQITVQTLGIWNQTSGKLSAGNQAKVVLDYLEEDFQGLVMRNDGGAWILATIEQPDANPFDAAAMADAKWNASGVTNGRVKPQAGGNAESADDDSLDFQTQIPITRASKRDLNEYRFGQSGVWLRMITNERTPGGAESSIRAVGYQIVRITPTDMTANAADSDTTERRYQLYRSAVSANNTFNAGYDLSMVVDPGDPGYNAPDESNLVAGNISRPSRDFLLANNVVDFGVRFWSKNAAGDLTLLYPSTATNLGFSGPGTTAITPPNPSGMVVGDMTAGTPAVVDVFVRVLTDEGARLLANYEYGRTDMDAGFGAGDEDKYWWDLVVRNSDVFTRRIVIPTVVK